MKKKSQKNLPISGESKAFAGFSIDRTALVEGSIVIFYKSQKNPHSKVGKNHGDGGGRDGN